MKQKRYKDWGYHLWNPFTEMDEFLPYLEKIWNSYILTNNGPYHQELEQNFRARHG